MSFHFSKNPTDNQKKEMLSIYNSIDIVSVFQHPFFELKPNSRFFYLKDSKGAIVSYCKVQESRFTKLKMIKIAELLYGVIGQNNSLNNELYQLIVSYYQQNSYTSLSVYPYQNSDLAFSEKIKPRFITHNKKDSIWIDLKLSETEIKKGFSKMLIRNLTKAEKNNFVVRILTSQSDIERFVEVNRKMSEARGLNFSSSDMNKIIDFIHDFDTGFILGCYSEDNKLLGGILVLKQGCIAEYFIAATDPDFKTLPLSHLTMLKAIEYSKSLGSRYFDLGGIVLNANPSDQVFNITNFKKLFSKNYKIYEIPYEIRFSNFKHLMKVVYLKLSKL